MINYLRFFIILAISFVFHLLILIVLPPFEIDFKKVKPVEIKINLETLKPVKEINRKDREEDLFENLSKGNLKEKLKKKLKKKISSEPIESKLPVMDTDKKIVLNEEKKIDIQETGVDLNKPEENEIIKEFQKVRRNINKKVREKSTVGNENLKSDFYEIKNITNINRKIVYEPKKPTFSLEKSTSISLSFKIDRYGKPFGITLLTRNDIKIEQMAINFVKGLRFEAVDYDEPDRVEITFYFKVR